MTPEGSRFFTLTCLPEKNRVFKRFQVSDVEDDVSTQTLEVFSVSTQRW